MLSVKPWRVEPVIYFCAAVLSCICFGALVSSVLGHAKVSGFAETDDFGNVLVGTFTFQGMVLVLGTVFFRQQKLSLMDVLGLRARPYARVLGITMITFVAVLPAVWLLQWSCVTALTWLGHPPDDQLAVQLFEKADVWWKRAYLGGFAILVAPVAEEFIFRGLLYPCAKQYGSSRLLAICISLMVGLRTALPLHHHLGLNWLYAVLVGLAFAFGVLFCFFRRLSVPRLAVTCVSLLFALIHFDAATLLPLFVLAIALTWLYEKTDTLLAPMAVHALFNSANLAMLVINNFQSNAPPQ